MKTTVAVLATLVALLATGSTARAHHFNRGHFVPAFRPCTAAQADTMTSHGVPACSSPVPLSDCAARPATALRVGAEQRSSYTMEPKGRRRTRDNGGAVDMDSRVGSSEITTCDGTPFTGTLKVEIVARMQRDDPACSTGHCTLPDFTYTHDLPCEHGICSMIGGANAGLVMSGLPPLPSDQTFRMFVVRAAILDLDGTPLLNTGMAVSGATVAEVQGGPGSAAAVTAWLSRVMGGLLPEDAEAYGSTSIGAPRRNLTRLVQAFAPCDAGSTDTTTGDGQAACTTTVLSDCALDPDAVNPVIPLNGNFIDTGKGKIDLGILGDASDPLLRTRGWIDGLQACDGKPFNGTIAVRAIVRATLLDPACTGGFCTTVDTPLVSGLVDVVDGGVESRQFDHLTLDFPASEAATATLNAEIVKIEFLDPHGNPFMVGPSWLVRCNFSSTNPNQPGGEAFCFGN